MCEGCDAILEERKTITSFEFLANRNASILFRVLFFFLCASINLDFPYLIFKFRNASSNIHCRNSIFFCASILTYGFMKCWSNQMRQRKCSQEHTEFDIPE